MIMMKKNLFHAYTLCACYLLKYACLSIRNFHHKSLNANYYYQYKCIRAPRDFDSVCEAV